MADQQNFQIFGAGNALLDISSEVEPEVFEKYEIQAGNAILAEEKHMPLYEELMARDDVQYIPGGATLNSIRVAQWMLGEEGKTAYMGILGKDENANVFINGCKKEGVETSFCYSDDKATGACAVCIHKANRDRSLVANLSCCNDFKGEHVNAPESKALWENAQCAYISGFWLTVCPEGMVTIGKHMQENGRPFCVNISAPFIAQFFNSQLKTVLPYVSILFGNESEAVALGAALNLEDKSISGIAQYLTTFEAPNGPRKVIITQGKDATIVATSEGVTTFDTPELAQESIVDTNGAGDGFVGGYLSGLVRDQDEATCVAYGNYAAQFIIQTSGTQFGDAKPTMGQ